MRAWPIISARTRGRLGLAANLLILLVVLTVLLENEVLLLTVRRKNPSTFDTEA